MEIKNDIGGNMQTDKYQSWHGFIGMIAALVMGLIFCPSTGAFAQEPVKPVLILADVSGSMQDPALPFEKEGKEEGEKGSPKKGYTKAQAVKELLLRMSRRAAGSEGCGFGVYGMRYLAGYDEVYRPILPLDSRFDLDAQEVIADDFITDYPVFNRRSAIGDALRQLDPKELESLDGRMTIVLISDGKETFFDIEADLNEAEPEGDDDPVKGPFTEIRRLKRKYSGNLTLHTVYFEDRLTEGGDPGSEIGTYISDNPQVMEKNVPGGGQLLERMAGAGGGKGFSGTALLRSDAAIEALMALLCNPSE